MTIETLPGAPGAWPARYCSLLAQPDFEVVLAPAKPVCNATQLHREDMRSSQHAVNKMESFLHDDTAQKSYSDCFPQGCP